MSLVSERKVPLDEATIRPPHLGPDQNVVYLMVSIIARLEQDLRNMSLRKLNLTYMHFRVLQFLISSDGAQINEIARSVAVRPPVLSRVLNQMEERDLVRRKTDDKDSRVTRVLMTENGFQQYMKAWPTAHKLVTQSLEALGDAEQKKLLSYLRKMASTVVES